MGLESIPAVIGRDNYKIHSYTLFLLLLHLLYLCLFLCIIITFVFETLIGCSSSSFHLELMTYLLHHYSGLHFCNTKK